MKTKMDFPNINERRPEGLDENGRPYRVLIVDDSMFVTNKLARY
jgi:two-component system chemotaxis response regulator CheY